MLVQTKVQLDKESYDFIKKVHKELSYKSLSEYIRDAVSTKIREDRKRIREKKRAAALEMLGEAPEDNLFEAIEGDDFEEQWYLPGKPHPSIGDKTTKTYFSRNLYDSGIDAAS